VDWHRARALNILSLANLHETRERMASVPSNTYSRPLDGQVRLMTKVARMYHERGIRQADIAEALNISQAKVSRLL
jgi:predicted XRE-type DNA-binding protein